MDLRVRFAPSPTGTLHLGSARSALYNWLVARHHGATGTYVLRIEDTDRERSTPAHVDQALAVFRWLGLDWDEGPVVGGPFGPYSQSERGGSYVEAIATLRADERAYPCFCTKEQLDADRAAAEAARRPFIYAGRCRALTPDDAWARADGGEQHVVRLAIPESGTTTFTDLILGELSFENAELGDFVLARADGSPLYNFANVVDDVAMGITHVIRGNDHVSNTPRQVLVYEALGHTTPTFAHVPMVLGPDGAKLSKRRHHTSTIEQLAAEGYVPSAVRNGIALIGWNRDDDTTYLTTDELIEAFDITRVKKSPASVDYDKLKHINGLHLRAMDPAAFAAAYDEWRRDWLPADDDRHADAHAVTPAEAALLVGQKVDLLGDVPGFVGFLAEPFAIRDDAWERLAGSEGAVESLEAVVRRLDDLDDFSVDGVEQGLRGACADLDAKPRVVFGPVRFAVTGRTVTPGLFESIHVLGRERSLERLRAAITRLAAAHA